MTRSRFDVRCSNMEYSNIQIFGISSGETTELPLVYFVFVSDGFAGGHMVVIFLQFELLESGIC